MHAQAPPGSTGLTIEFTTVPPIGSYVNLKGIVHHPDLEHLRIAVYIRVRGGWWTKPYWDAPATSISSDGSFSVDITTGGHDEEATEIAAFLIREEDIPPDLRGEPEFPAELLAAAVGRTLVTRAT